ncbi:hypothetical protein FISHEDRAFT_52302 [Fistulina hepatica ATCC 64428]|nr:hypothetical protein FISHEDRAFT_52302 [Fistulina hepatica ATCC 64428]
MSSGLPSVLKIPGREIQFAYIDSGVADVQDYVTLIVVHGFGFHNQVMKKILPLAPSHGLRLICVNRRQYPGSTPYNADELAVWAAGSDDARFTLLQKDGLDLALFVDSLIEKGDIPRGPLALVGWSMGITQVLAILAAVHALPDTSRQRLQSYIRLVVLLDPPYRSLGYDDIAGGYAPFGDETIPPGQRGAAQSLWLSSYFSHENTANRDPAQFTWKPNPGDAARPTLELMSGDELSAIADNIAAEACDLHTFLPTFRPTLARLRRYALFDDTVRQAWPLTKIRVTWNDRSPWDMIWGSWALEKEINVSVADKLDIHFQRLRGFNHFVRVMRSSLCIPAYNTCFFSPCGMSLLGSFRRSATWFALPCHGPQGLYPALSRAPVMFCKFNDRMNDEL